jgi:hypothetical protein
MEHMPADDAKVKPKGFYAHLYKPVGIAFLLASAYFYNATREFLHTATTTEGTVVALRERVSTDENKKKVSYAPVVTFVTGTGKKFEFLSTAGSNPPAYTVGQKVEVLYLPADPRNARIHDFISLWGIELILGLAGAVILLTGWTAPISPRKKDSENDLPVQRVPIRTEFQRVTMNKWVSANSSHPYRIVTQWKDPSTSEIHVFQSENIWFDPTGYIKTTHITVYIERDNPEKYVFDLSFLPKTAG